MKCFENIVGKGENAGHQPFLLFPQIFLTFRDKCRNLYYIFIRCLRGFLPFGETLPFSSNLKLPSANFFNLEESKI